MSALRFPLSGGLPAVMFFCVWLVAILALFASTWVYHQFLGGLSVGLNVSYVAWIVGRIGLTTRRRNKQREAETARILAEYTAMREAVHSDNT